MRTLAIVPVLLLAACKPPPTDADMLRDMPEEARTFASDPLPSPDTQGAFWAPSTEAGRIIYGVPGQPALIALECKDSDGELATLRITRLAPADEGAKALMALIGNGAVGRIEVEARDIGNRTVWQGELLAADTKWDPLAGPRKVTVTVPGAGMVTLNPGEIAWQSLNQCRGASPLIEPPETTALAPREPVLPPIP